LRPGEREAENGGRRYRTRILSKSWKILRSKKKDVPYGWGFFLHRGLILEGDDLCAGDRTWPAGGTGKKVALEEGGLGSKRGDQTGNCRGKEGIRSMKKSFSRPDDLLRLGEREE